jgi:hypothetical protein
VFSPWAALRSLVLPFGALTGTRIVLDGVNGRISVFDGTDDEVIRLDSATSALTVSGSDGSQVELLTSATSATTRYLPPTASGQTWAAGEIYADHDGTSPNPYPQMSIRSPYETTNAGGSLILISGPSKTDPTSLVDILATFCFLDSTTVSLGAGDDSGSTSLHGAVTCNGYPVTARVGRQINTSTTSNFTAETVTDSITVPLISGKEYEIIYNGLFTSTAAGDRVNVRIREDSVSGTGIDGDTISVVVANTLYRAYERAPYTAASTGNKTFVVTGQRATGGAGNITRASSATNPSITTVDMVS